MQLSQCDFLQAFCFKLYFCVLSITSVVSETQLYASLPSSAPRENYAVPSALPMGKVIWIYYFLFPILILLVILLVDCIRVFFITEAIALVSPS